MNISEKINKCKAMIEEGKSTSMIVETLYKDGLTITESMKVIREAFAISLGEAKTIVSDHSVWNETVEVSKPIQEAFIKSIYNED